MFEDIPGSETYPSGVLVAAVRTAFDEIYAADLLGASDDELIACTRDLDAQLRRAPALEHRLIIELTRRKVARRFGCKNMIGFLAMLLRLTSREAGARVAAAQRLGHRISAIGQPLEPLFPRTAQAQADGLISARHAKVITRTVDNLPPVVQAEHGAAVEQTLTEQAARLDPLQLGILGKRIEDTLNPDGIFTDEAEHRRRRTSQLVPNSDGSAELYAHLSPECRALWEVVFDSLAAPRPAVDGTPDPRTAGQRNHDALLEAAARLLATGELAPAGGVPATLLITMTVSELESRLGKATTGHGGDLSIETALRLAGDAKVIPMLMSDTGGIMSYGRGRRLASTAQRLALAARDRGCTFPGCDRPAAWTEVHHLLAWQHGGPTSIDNMCLVCGHDHREHERLGWKAVMLEGVPHWIPPAWIDPKQVPLRNTMHDPMRP